MMNLYRLKMEIKNIKLSDEELTIYLMENNLDATAEYTKQDNLNINKATLAILEAVANDINLMKTYKTQDISVEDFSNNLQNRIDQLNRKIREEEYKRENSGASFVYMFSR